MDFISKRSVPLDCIRATAIIMVVVFHVATRYPMASLDPVAMLFRKFGTLGVDIFFPLSGYLITSFLLRHTEKGTIKTFFMRRLFRIVPLYFLAVTIYYVAARILDTEPEIIDRIWITYTFLTGWFIFADGVDMVPYTITWSLSVEEFSYILIGSAAWFSRRNLLAFLSIVSLLSMALRFYLNVHEYEGIYHFPLARIDSIAIGGLVAYFMHKRIPILWPLIAAALLSEVIRLIGGAFGPTFLYTMVTLVTCVFIVAFENYLRSYRGAIAVQYAKVGFYSYFIYLFHFMVLEGQMMIQRWLGFEGMPFWVSSAICLGLTYLLAVMSFRFFEGPLLAFGRRLESRGDNVAGQVAVK